MLDRGGAQRIPQYRWGPRYSSVEVVGWMDPDWLHLATGEMEDNEQLQEMHGYICRHDYSVSICINIIYDIV